VVVTGRAVSEAIVKEELEEWEEPELWDRIKPGAAIVEATEREEMERCQKDASYQRKEDRLEEGKKVKESAMPAGIPKLFMLRKFKNNNKKYISKM
jgi:hypothetical protein